MKARHSRFTYLWLSTIFFLLPYLTFSQAKIKVVDENLDALIGVYVSYNDIKTTTDIDGYWYYDINLDNNTVINLTYIGYQDLNVSLEQIKSGTTYIQMTSDNKLLDEVVIIGRTNARAIDLPYNVVTIKADAIRKSQAQNSAEALEISGGAYIQKSQMGGGSPILRGFEANKVLLVVDGVRMNNAIYRSGHLQNAITIDPNILDQAEVIFGPGSLMYGSEALGGVVHYRTRSPLFNFDERTDYNHIINADLRYSSANQEKRVHIDHTFSKRNFGVLTSLTYTDYSDLRTGNNRKDIYPEFGTRSGLLSEYVQVIEGQDDQIINNENPKIQIGTAFSQLDFLQKYALNLSDNLKSELNIQYSTSSDIPRYDNLAERSNNGNGALRFAEWYYGPQQRLLISPKLTYTSDNKLFDKIYLITSFQKISEDRYSRRINNPILEIQEEDVKIFGMTLDFNKRINQNQKVVYGIDVHHNDVQSFAEGIDRNNSTNTVDILTRYPSGGSQLLNAGIYLQHNYQNRDSSLIWITGLRYTQQKVNLNYLQSDPFQWPDYFYEGIRNNSKAIVGVTGLNYQKNNWLIKTSIGNAFRSPNVDDLAKVRVNGREVTIPNPELNSEKVINTELTIEYKAKQISLGLTGYYTLIDDAIVRKSFLLPDGSSTYIVSGDTLDVVANVNDNKGNIKGISINLNYQATSSLSLQSAFNYQRGTSEDSEGIQRPLGHIPPTFGYNQISYDADLYSITLTHKYNAWKRIEDYGGSVDNPEFAPLEGTPSWQTIDIDASYNYSINWAISAGIHNLLDSYYRPFASGLSGAGRQLIVSIRYSGS